MPRKKKVKAEDITDEELGFVRDAALFREGYKGVETKETLASRGMAISEMVEHKGWLLWFEPYIKIEMSDQIRTAFNTEGDKRVQAVGAFNELKKLLRTIKKWKQDHVVAIQES